MVVTDCAESEAVHSVPSPEKPALHVQITVSIVLPIEQGDPDLVA